MDQGWTNQIADLVKQLSSHGIDLPSDIEPRLASYCEAMHSNSDRIGLISPNDLPHFVSKHIAASCGPLLIAPPQPDEEWIDVGTGGGLPGMVLKMCRPDLKLTLIDSSHKKTNFLKDFQEDRKIQDLRILTARVEEINRDYEKFQASAKVAAAKLAKKQGGGRRHKHYSANRRKNERIAAPKQQTFDVVVMRAVTSLKRSLPLIESITLPGARLITFKGLGWREELADAAENLAKFGWTHLETKQIPFAQPKLLLLSKDARDD